MMEVITVELNHIAAREGRLSYFLREEMALSAGLMNRLKWKDRILVNGKPEHTDFAVKPGDRITVCLEDPDIEYPAEDGPLTILLHFAGALPRCFARAVIDLFPRTVW